MEEIFSSLFCVSREGDGDGDGDVDGDGGGVEDDFLGLVRVCWLCWRYSWNGYPTRLEGPGLKKSLQKFSLKPDTIQAQILENHRAFWQALQGSKECTIYKAPVELQEF